MDIYIYIWIYGLLEKCLLFIIQVCLKYAKEDKSAMAKRAINLNHILKMIKLIKEVKIVNILYLDEKPFTQRRTKITL